MNNHATGIWPILLTTCLLFIVAGSLHAAPSDQQWQALNRSTVEQHILPRYKTLQSTSQQLNMAIDGFCKHPDIRHLEEAQSAFHNTFDAWQSVQHIQFGPIETLMRNYSIQFWPDKKNLTGKQLNALLKKQDPETLSTDYLYRASIAVKGLPALERLLFQSDLQALNGNSYRCQLATAISGYIAENSKSTLDEWHEYYAEAVFSAGEDESLYESHQEAAVDIMKSLVEPIEVIRDLKILRPLGKEGKLKPRRLESWRSERSLHNISLNIASLKHLYSGTEHNLKAVLEQQGVQQKADEITQQIALIEQQLDKLPEPLTNTLTKEDTAVQFKALSDQLKVLHIQLLEAMQLIKIQLGFNSRDGD